jgi:hypothetical protein
MGRDPSWDMIIFSENAAIAKEGIDPLTLGGNLRQSVLSAAF